jgi:flavodoxin I
MSKTGIFYSFNTKKSKLVAEKIIDAFGKDNLEINNTEDINEKTFLKYDNLILSVPTWFDGELPNYWDEFVPAIEDMDLNGKKVAMFGLGNQRDYSENFVDGIGILGDLLEERGAELIGFTSTNGYQYESSRAERGEQFCGLAIDQDTQAKLTNKRVKDWVEQVKGEF